MKYIADFHIHSQYSRATSKDCVPEMLDLWARRKGLNVIGTGDFTHPAWREELKEKLVPAEEGLYILKEEYCVDQNALLHGNQHSSAAFDSALVRPRFILSTEISSIYKKKDKVRKVHNVILLPSLEAAEALANRLELVGNLHSDGRPILGLDSHDLLEITLEICPEAIFIPAHIWTPHFSLFGAYSGFNRIEECFEDLTPHIHALETGLSSDPPMNWRISALDRFTLVSNSDAHSPSKLAREANLFDTDLSYSAIAHALSHKESGEFVGTLEFYPEEGKYHLDGHRKCKVCLTPSETVKAAGICPSCGRRITVGVLHRIEELVDRAEGFQPHNAKMFERIIPLPEAVAASIGVAATSKRVQAIYEDMLCVLGSELYVLRQAPLEEISRLAGPCAGEGIRRIRAGEICWQPGYDGEYGRVTVLNPSEISYYSGQMSFFALNSIKSAAAKHSNHTNESKIKKVAEGKENITEVESERSLPHYGLNDQQWEAVSAHAGVITVIAGPGTGKTRTLIYHIKYLIEEQNVSPAAITAVTFTNKAAAEMRSRLESELADKKAAKKVNIGTFHGICLRLLKKWRGEITLLTETETLFIAQSIKEELGIEASAREILQSISDCKNALERDHETVSKEVLDLYQSKLSEYGAFDYDDLILQVLNQFETEPETQLKKERKAFQRLLVDEFQDINGLQYRLLSAWGKESEELFVIGDPDQAIYGFRGSDPYCFTRLQNEYPQCQRVQLSLNYRSTPEIIGCALPVLKTQHGSGKFSGDSLTAQRSAGKKVKIMTAETPFSEALYIAKEINRLVGGIDMLDSDLQDNKQQQSYKVPGFSDIAILYRTHRQATILEECLRKEGIPYIVAGKDKFLEDEDVRAAIVFFRHLLNPQDLAAEKQSERLFSREQLDELKHIFTEQAVRKEKPWKLLDLWMEKNNLGAEAEIGHLRNMAVLHKNMAALLENLTLGEEIDIRRSGSKVYRSDAVTLMTFHGAKGLEFPVVFLCGLKEGQVPLQSYAGVTDISEERRLFYVAMTRARDELVLLTTTAPSQFLKELPDSLIEKGTAWKRPQSDGQQLSLF